MSAEGTREGNPDGKRKGRRIGLENGGWRNGVWMDRVCITDLGETELVVFDICISHDNVNTDYHQQPNE